jgi:dCTP deaminase
LAIWACSHRIAIMILSDGTLRQLLDSGELYISPIADNAIQPASVDCRIGSHYLVVDDTDSGIITFDEPIKYREIEEKSIVIPPHSFLLATTMEYIALPNHITAFVEGRSSIGRMGLFIQNAGWVDAGFEGQITLELYNANSLPIKLESGHRVCQLVFCEMDKPAVSPYRGKYFKQRNSVGSRIFLDDH